ncbi:FtsX-like permease family protein [Orbus wheelerorum]|uniref:ABC transporter permease n=1 Tax=Orbus wheelerorum TaxID=3074111 RepID=UPI00370D93C5
MTKHSLSYLLIIRLALKDLYYDKKVSFCICALIISVITPLLLLFSLKFGVVSQLRHQLMNDPQNLEIKVVGNLQLNDAIFTWIQAQPETAFVIPLTRSLNTQADLMAGRNLFVNNAEMIPTANGDPITKGLPSITIPDQVIISGLTAEKLSAKVGDVIKLVITRQLDGKIEKGLTALTVIGILPEQRYSRAAVFVSLDLLITTEDFYDGYLSDTFLTGTGKTVAPKHSDFARARIYAKSLENVASLAFKLRSQNIETRTQATSIENMQAIDRVLGFIFSVIAVTSILGCILAFVGTFWVNIDRKRKDIAFMRLLGLGPLSIIGFLIIQSVVLSCIAFIISCLLFLIGNYAFNIVLGDNLVSQPMVSQLLLYHFGIAFITTLLISLLVVGIGGVRAVKIEPAESLREV